MLGAGVQGGYFESDSTGKQTYSGSIDWTINATGLSGDLIAGLITNQSFGTGFSSLQFNISVGGTQVVGQNFITLAAAQSYFNDHALDLGTFGTVDNLPVDFNFTLVTSSSGAGFGEDFLLGATGGSGTSVIAAPTAVINGQNHATAVSGGTNSAAIPLLAQFAAAGFPDASDHGTGTALTYTPLADAVDMLAPSHGVAR